MAYQIVIKKSALKELSQVPHKYANKIKEKIDQLSDIPFPDGCKKLKGSENDFRIRIGNYRIIYSVFKEILVIQVIKIAHRKEVYRK